FAARRAVGAGVLAEVVVEAVVLLHQEDDVLDRVSVRLDRGGRAGGWTDRVRGATRPGAGRALGAAARPELPQTDQRDDDDDGDRPPAPRELVPGPPPQASSGHD